MEVLHALLHPLNSEAVSIRHARFYSRDEAYTKELHTKAHKDLFIPSRNFFRLSDKGVEAFRKRIEQQHPTVPYTARWNPQMPSPELTGELANGSLVDFSVGKCSLEEDVLAWLKEAISEEYPGHQELPVAAMELDRELDLQDTQRFQSGDGYIPRPAEEQALARNLKAARGKPLVLLAKAGCGKTSLLAAFLQTQQERPVYYRFVGTTPRSFRLEDLSVSLTEQWVRDGLLPESVLKYTPMERKLIFPTLCIQAAEVKPFLLVLDGMDQLLDGEQWYSWLPKQMPEGAQLLISLRDTGAQLPDTVAAYRLGLMTDPNDRAQMISSYLNAFLKDIDQEQMNQLLAMEGSTNPLYLKIVLNELRQHGSFDTLMELFQRDYGSTPLSAFQKVLQRVEQNLKTTCFQAAGAMALFFGCLAYARQGLNGRFFQRTCRNISGWDENVISDRQVLDLVYGLAREMEPYLVMDGDRIALRYDSLRQAIRSDKAVLYAQYTNILLAQGFLLQLEDTYDPEDARTTLIHISDSTEEYIRSCFSNADCVVKLIECGGAETVAVCCDDLVQQRGIRDFGDLAKVLHRAAARLDTNPKTLFMELERYGDPSNPVTAALMKNGKAYPTGVLLHPKYRPKNAGALCWEYAHPKSTSEVWAEPYFVNISKNILRVTDLRTRKLMCVKHLPQQEWNDSVFLTAEKDILYLCHFSDSYSRVQICSYKLPDMQPAGDVVTADCPHGVVWNLLVFRGKHYAVQFHSTASQKYGGRYTLSCLQTGTVLFSDAVKNFRYRLCGSWFVYQNNDTGMCRVLSLESGKCLFEDQHLGNIRLNPGATYQQVLREGVVVQKAELYVACGEKLYIKKIGAGLRADGEVEALHSVYRFAPCGDGLFLECKWNENIPEYGNFSVLDNRYLITESEGYLQILDSNGQSLGKLNLGEGIHQTDQANISFALFNDQILAFHSDKIRSYDTARLLAALDTDLKQPVPVRRSSAIIDGNLYVMDFEMERINLKTLEMVREEYTAKQYKEQYDSWNMLGQDIWIGYGLSGNVTLKKPETLERLEFFIMPDANKRELRHAFLYRDEQGRQRIGLIQTDIEKEKQTFAGDERGLTQVWLRTKLLADLPQNGEWTEDDLQVRIAVNGMCLEPTSITAKGNPYLIFPNVYKAPETVQMRIYDLRRRGWIYVEDVDLNHSALVHEDDFHVFPGGFMWCCGRGEHAKLRVINLTKLNIQYMDGIVKILSRDSLASKVVLHDSSTRELLAYDWQTNKNSTITVLEKYDCGCH